MALQTSIAEYFNLRKRGASVLDEGKNNINTAPSKVLILQDNLVNVEAQKPSKDVDIVPSRAYIYVNDSPSTAKSSSTSSRSVSVKRSRKRSTHKERTSTGQGDIRKCLWPEKFTKEEEPQDSTEERLTSKLIVALLQKIAPESVNVPFRIHHISPKKKFSTPTKSAPQEKLENRPLDLNTNDKSAAASSTPTKSALIKDEASKLCSTPQKGDSQDSIEQKTPVKVDDSRPEVGDRQKKSKKLADLKERLKKLHGGRQELKEIQERKKKLQDSPKIKQFDTLEFEVVASPKKSTSEPEVPKVPASPSLLRRALFMSPQKPKPGASKYTSPRKLFETPPQTSPMKPAYQRYEDLASTGKPALPLPYKYRRLAETFRSVDTVASMMFNRKENIVFDKLQSSVQQLSNRQLTETHIGQIQTVLPSAFKVRREKRRFAQNKKEEYTLILKPTFSSDGGAKGDGENGELMTPSVLLQRRRNFYDALLSLVIDRHQVFLGGLDPPLVIPKNQLMRWHPDFDVDAACPEIAASLPPLPVQEKLASAKDVLGKAKDMFCTNNRMEKALEKLSEGQAAAPKTEATAAAAAFAKALKGIPKSLLEKVRAKQAAKTAALLTRSPGETKRRMELTRLPELARILRMIFVLERKNVLPMPLVYEKVAQSHRESLSPEDILRHIHHIMASVPGWIVEHTDGDKKYLRLSRDADFAKITDRLKRLIDENQVNI
ncbi:DNA replication factor Cdt1 [Nesidiocoris tenuis]|uniref:DNA replication factor Cdt1 n=1 Tax=Nesidiocoris tenuis TaxID=355587 RepID=A0ABN7BGT6_9HEMI|nr:DNA replication factor Cdt1 [Nesidiocoris tenuis]